MSTNSLPLYAYDSHLREFDAEVVKAGPRFVVLDRTTFYPESGGQPSDTGTITHGKDRIKVFKVMKRGSEIFHYLEGDIPAGSRVHGAIDWEWRLWNMRRHSAEHLLTGLIEALGEPPKVFSDLERLEYQPSNLTVEQIKGVERRFNEIVEEDVPVRVYYEDRAAIDAGGDARKQGFLRKIPANVDRLRMVDIGPYASTFCFGTHVSSTREIGHIKSLRLEEGKKGRKIVHFQLES